MPTNIKSDEHSLLVSGRLCSIGAVTGHVPAILGSSQEVDAASQQDAIRLFSTCRCKLVEARGL